MCSSALGSPPGFQLSLAFLFPSLGWEPQESRAPGQGSPVSSGWAHAPGTGRSLEWGPE